MGPYEFAVHEVLSERPEQWFSDWFIAQLAGVPRRTAKYHLRRLVDAGLVEERAVDTQWRTLYRVTVSPSR